MPADRHTQQLPASAAKFLNGFLSISPDVKSTWSEVNRDRYEDLCKVLTGNTEKEIKWSFTEWNCIVKEIKELKKIPKDYSGLVPENEGLPRKDWTEQENMAFSAIARRIPQPQITLGDIIELEKNEVIEKSNQGFVGTHFSTCRYEALETSRAFLLITLPIVDHVPIRKECQDWRSRMAKIIFLQRDFSLSKTDAG
ncbi:hypothetical protein HYALB_00005954 [Hymenoscyphus albidus]|uniref:Uncharacterized protein n=1 Tax=Hymenoscyphus albidus TaxID=595503 RepID=A0A9N9LEZ8_9HELO|nr:hypothetical protein HYALB_00005954 [Hymenoscyphus albidus]